eukprot:Stramenopile-MAST_4_protein_6396
MLVATPDWRDANGDQFVELTTNPAAHDDFDMGGALLIGMFTVIHTTSQTRDLQFAVVETYTAIGYSASTSGRLWGGGDHLAYKTNGFLDPEDESVHLYFSGTELHADFHSTMPSESFYKAKLGAGWNFRDMRLG